MGVCSLLRPMASALAVGGDEDCVCFLWHHYCLALPDMTRPRGCLGGRPDSKLAKTRDRYEGS